MNTKTFTAVAALCALAGVAPAFSADFTDDELSAINKALVGQWAGRVESIGLGNGETTEEDSTFTYAITSEDGLNATIFGAGGLDWATYQGDGVYVVTSWLADGTAATTENQVTDLSPLTEEGDFSMRMSGGRTTLADGSEMEGLATYRMEGGVYTVTQSVRPLGSDDEFSVVGTGAFTRVE